MSEDISVAAAILTAEIVKRSELNEQDAYRLWRRMRSRMRAALVKEQEEARASWDAPANDSADDEG